MTTLVSHLVGSDICNTMGSKKGNDYMMQIQEEEFNRSIYSHKLLDNQNRVLSLFVEKVRNNIPSAKSLDDETLRNSLFEFLTTIADIISFGEASDKVEIFKENIEKSREHGRTRASIPTYTLDQVITEFRILRFLIFFVLEDDGALPPIERDKIFFAIDNGMTQAATEFAFIRGFKDARLTEEISAKNLALDQANYLRDEQKQREQFFSAVTHDMRNPLAVARTSAEIISRHPDDKNTVIKYANKIISSLDRSNLMIKDLLDSNSLKSGGKLSLHRETCDLSALIREVKDDLSEVYGSRFKISSLPSTLGMFDCHAMRRALENLMVNAIKYGSQNGDITLSLIRNNQEIRIQVHNEGNPIPLKDQASLFDHKYRTENAEQGIQEGWGIGLTLAKGVAEAHDGKIEVTSSREKGTTFSIILPNMIL